MPHQLPTYQFKALHFLLLGLFFFVATEFSRMLSADVSNMSAIWPALGLAIGAATVMGPKVTGVYAAALGTWLIYNDFAPAPALAVLLEQTAQCALASHWLRHRLGQWQLLGSLLDTLRFYFWGTLAALLPTSFAATFFLYQQGLFSDFRFVDVWLVYWLSEALGVLLFAPLAQSMAARLAQGWKPQWPPAKSLAMSGALVGLFVFSALLWQQGQVEYGKAITYLYFPLLAWMAMSGQRWLPLVSLPLVATAILGYVILTLDLQDAPAGFLLVEAVLVIFMMTLMTQLIQSVSAERGRLSEEFKQQARRDRHTGLLNDRGLLEKTDRGRRETPRKRHYLAVLEVKNFADALDILDLDFAREMEQYIGQILAEKTRNQPVARLSAGRYACYLGDSNEGKVITQMETTLASLNGHNYHSGDSVYVLGVSVGVVALGEHDSTDAGLSAAGQSARLAARNTGRPLTLCDMQDDLVQERQKKLSLLEDIKRALNDNRFILYAQAVEPTENNNQPGYHEVLIRMLDSNGRAISPGEFLPAAQDYGLMGEIDRWVVSSSFAWLEERRREGDRPRKLAINLSGSTLGDPGFSDWVSGIARHHGIEPDTVGFEVTESELIDDWSACCDLLTRLREQGFTISLDDFGTGLATFEYLTRFPFDIVKIDGAFIRDLLENPVHRAIVSSVTSVADVMSLKTVAEFVEDQAMSETLTSLGVDFLQGYGVGKPQPLDNL
ncbi:MAG: EAL domain-containing protein [Pseudomonadota bacterium]